MPLASATRVGPYEIVSTLGGGAMGEVYLARDSRLNRNVALKIIAPGSSDDAIRRRRFEGEARAASSLNHPNIITVHDFGSIDGISYIVSELVEGESFRNLIHRGALPIRQLLELAVQMADGLAAAHEAGIVHRDLKPENVMVSRSGRVKILDFGLAKPMLSPVDADEPDRPTFDGSPTEPGLILGTVGYMSPEQARGETVGIESDQFSFGAILHEMATGTPAFKRETPMQTLLAIANVDRMPFTPGPVAFRLLVERCLSKDPAARFASTGEVRDRLQRILDGLPKPAEDAEEEPSVPDFESSSGSMIAAKPRPPHSSRQLATAVLGGLLVFSLGLVAARLIARSPAPDIANYHFSPLVSNSSIDAFPSLSPSGHTVAYSEPVDGMFQIFTQQLSGPSRMQVTRSSQDCFYPFWSPDGLRIYYVSGGSLWSASSSGGSPEIVARNVLSADASPKNGMLALLEPHGQGLGASLWLMNHGGEAKRVDGLPPVLAGQVKFSSDGSEIGLSATTLDGTAAFWVMSVASRQVHRYSSDPMRGFSFFPDGRHILYGSDHLWRSDALDARPAEITAGSGHENWPSVARDGHNAVFSTADTRYNVVAWTAAGGGPAINVPGPSPFSNSDPVWSPKRAEFAYVSEQGGAPEIRLRDAVSGWEKRIASSSDFPDQTLAFSGLAIAPDGQRIVYTRTSRDGDSIWESSPTGEKPVRLAKGSHPAWSPDGNWVAFSTIEGERIETRKIHLGSSEAPQLVKAGTGETLAWSLDGKWILSARPDGVLVLVSPDGRTMQRVGTAKWLSATWARDGNHILGLRATGARTLELVSLDRNGVEDGPKLTEGGASPALSFGGAIGLAPVQGFSVSPDGSTILLSMVQARSDLWTGAW